MLIVSWCHQGILCNPRRERGSLDYPVRLGGSEHQLGGVCSTFAAGTAKPSDGGGEGDGGDEGHRPHTHRGCCPASTDCWWMFGFCWIPRYLRADYCTYHFFLGGGDWAADYFVGAMGFFLPDIGSCKHWR